MTLKLELKISVTKHVFQLTFPPNLNIADKTAEKVHLFYKLY